jgi:phosphatidate cytidylyltransferase
MPVPRDPADDSGDPRDPGAGYADERPESVAPTAGSGTPSPAARARRVAGPAVAAQQRMLASRPSPGARRTAGAAASAAPAASLDPEPAPTEVEAASRAGRNLPAAIGVGLGLGAVILISLFAYRPSFAVIVALAVLYGCWEFARALRTADVHVSLLPVVVGAAAILAAAWERGPSGLVLAVLLTFVAVLAWRIGDGAQHYARDVAASAFTIAYLPTLAGFAVLLAHPHDGAARVLAFVATVVCSDTGGYAAGVLFGRHPLAPIVSKAKTWEGFVGSVVACSIAGVLFLVLTFHQQWWQGLLFGLAIVVTATLGDLGESMIKRDLEIKDMGSLLPGHGGLMDRLDSLLPCAAVAYLLLSAFTPA